MNAARSTSAIVFAISLFAAALTATAQTIQVSKENRTIAITTTDEAEAIADRAVVSIGFTTYGSDQDQTYADASKTSNAIMKALKDAGVKADAIESTRQHLSQIDDSDKLRYAKGIRFVFSQEWTITGAAKNAADILHLAVTSGANDSGDIDWQLRDEQALESEAAEKALIHAQQIAERMAKGLRATLGPLVYASNQTPSTRLNDMVTDDALVPAPPPAPVLKAKPLAISPAKITKSATVYAVFSLQ